MISASDILKSSILIVDDQVANIALLEQMLRRAGYTAISSTRIPQDVCELHRRNRYDLILLDLQMPGMDGFQVMAGLREVETSPQLPVLVITATPDHKLRALKAGAGDFVSKPFELAEVLLRAHNMLEIRLLHQKLTDRNFERLENAQRIAALGDWEYDFGRQCLLWSEGIYRILGIARSDFPPSERTFDSLVHPDDLALVQRERKAATNCAHRMEFEHRIFQPDGIVRYLHEITETAFDDQHRPVRQTGTMQDITERKHREAALRESEERFKFVARAVSDVVWDWDLAANTLWWNDGFLTTFGYIASEIEANVESRNRRIHPEDRERVVESLRRAIAGDAETWGAEYRFERKDGTYVIVQDRGYIVRDAAGKGLRMVGGMRDLTEQKKMESQFLRAQRMESIGTLAGGIAHDLNNVLAPIMMAVSYSSAIRPAIPSAAASSTPLISAVGAVPTWCGRSCPLPAGWTASAFSSGCATKWRSCTASSAKYSPATSASWWRCPPTCGPSPATPSNCIRCCSIWPSMHGMPCPMAARSPCRPRI
jgi:PAS domain S-box-containing protein